MSVQQRLDLQRDKLNYISLTRALQALSYDLRPPQASLFFTTESKKRTETRCVAFFCRCKQQTCIDHNTRHSHPWSDVVGGEGGVRNGSATGGRVGRREGEESVDGVRWE